MNTALRTATGALAVVATLALAGCVKLDADVSLQKDDTFSGEITYAFSDEILKQMDMDPEEFLEGFGEGSVDVTEYERKPYAEDGYSGETAIFDDAPFKELEDALNIRIEHEGDEFVVGGELLEDSTGDTAGAEGIPEMQEILDTMRFDVAITFPGPVYDTNGDVEGTTVTWESVGGESVPMEARASALTQEELDEIARAKAEAEAAAEREALLRKLTIWGAAAVGAIVLVALGIFLGRRNRGKGGTPAAGPEAGTAPEAPSAAVGQGAEAPSAAVEHGAEAPETATPAGPSSDTTPAPAATPAPEATPSATAPAESTPAAN